MSKRLQITVLKENSAARPGVLPGHGLSLLVETAQTRVLLDTGPDQTLLDNAAALGISLDPLDAIVLSHGHYDHTGGLAAVLKQLGPTRVIAHPGVFDDTYSRAADGTMRQIGIPDDQARCVELGATFEFTDLPVKLDGGIMSTGRVVPVRPAHAPGSSLMRRGRSGLMRDDFRDDLSLVVRLACCSTVLTGCAHAGLLNILYKAQTMMPEQPPRVVLGGLHMGLMDDDEIAAIAAEAYSLGVRTLLPCHCTGDHAVAVLRDKFQGAVVPIGTGAVITIHPDGGVGRMPKLN